MALAEPLLTDHRRQVLREVLDWPPRRASPRPIATWPWLRSPGVPALPSDAGRTIFTVARIAGWTAHYLEELGERPLRFRARAVYSV